MLCRQHALLSIRIFSPVERSFPGRRRLNIIGHRPVVVVVFVPTLLRSTSRFCSVAQAVEDKFVAGDRVKPRAQDGARVDVVRGGCDRRQAQDVSVFRRRQLHTDDYDGPRRHLPAAHLRYTTIISEKK